MLQAIRTQADAAVLQQVAQVVEHGALVLSADAAEVAQEATAVGHHLGESDLLETEKRREAVMHMHTHINLDTRRCIS